MTYDNIEKILADLEVSKKTIEAEISTLDKKMDELEERQTNIANAINALKPLVKTKPATRGTLYFLASRTRKNGPGHFIEAFADGTSKCSCEAGRYGGECWAQRWVKNQPLGSQSFRYITGNGEARQRNFDSRYKPFMAESYLPRDVQRL